MKQYIYNLSATLLLLFTFSVGQLWADDITVYVTGSIFVGEAWNSETSTIKVDVRYQGSDDNFNENDTYLDQEMTNTGYTYEGYPIYSYTFTPTYSGGQYRFKHYKGGEWKEDYTTVWTTESGKIYRGYYNETHNWVTFGRDITIYAVPESMDGSKWTEGNTLKSIFKYGDQDSEKTDIISWTKTEYTYDGNAMYTCTALMPYNVVKKITFYYNDGSDKELYDCTPSTEYGTDDIDGKIFLGWKEGVHKWVAYGYDITVYTIPDFVFKDYSTRFDNESHYAAICVQCGTGGTWKTFNMTKTEYTYDSYPIHKATIIIDNNKFWEYQVKYFRRSDDTQEGVYRFNKDELKTEYEPSKVEDKIYRGWITDTHIFTPYAYDVVLNKQTGSEGSDSVIVTDGSAMPAATMPGKSGYTFGGYWTEIAGEGTQYYATDGSSATNWNSRTITMLYAKWTQNISLDREGATTGSTTVMATYNSSTLGSMTNPSKDNYTFGGYYSGDNGTGQLIINTSKQLQANKTDGSTFTGEDGIWTHAGATTLYAKWIENPYTITTSASEGGTVGESGYTAYVATTTAISATPAAGYKFLEWQEVGETSNVTFANRYSASTTITATGAATIKAVFVYRWSIAGSWLNYSGSSNWDADTYAMGHVGANATSEDTCFVEIPLAANTQYTFNVVDREGSYTWYGNNTIDTYYMTYGNSKAWGFGLKSGGYKDCGITTAGAGNYKFAFNITDKTVTVTYPDAYVVTFGYGAGGSAVTATVEGDASALSESGKYAAAGKDVTFTQTPASGYSFRGWYNAATDGSAISCMASDDVYEDIAADIAVYAQYDPIDYTITYNLNGGSNHVSNPSGYTIITPTITLQAPTKTNYTFGGWYDNSSFSGDAITSIPLGSTGDTVLYAKWSETPRTITLAVSPTGAGTITPSGSATAYSVTRTTITAAAANPAWRFVRWDYDGDKITITDGTGYTDESIKIIANTDATLTAVFEPRYELNGSLNEAGDPTGGMPGWTYNNAASFDVVSFTALGEGDGKGVDLEYSCTLQPNKEYKFRVYDRESEGRWGISSTAVIPATGDGHNMKLNVFGEEGYGNILLNTVGYGTYTFRITNIYDNGDGKYYPALEVDRPISCQLTYGTNNAEAGYVTAHTDEGGSGFDISNGGFHASGCAITFTAHPGVGVQLEGWYSDSACTTPFDGDDTDVTIDGNTLVRSNITSNAEVYAKWKSTNFVIYRTGDKEGDSRALPSDVESYAGGTIATTIEYRMKVHALDQWYALCLPFTVSSVQVWEDGEYYDIVPYYRPEVGGTFYLGHYVIRTPKQTTNLPISEFGDWRDPESSSFLPAKNTPYIIQWHDGYFTDKYISFFGAAGQEIPGSMTDSVAPTADNVINIYGNNAMVAGSVAGAYVLNPEYGGGAWLRGEKATDYTTVRPFECYIRANSAATGKYLVIRRGMTIEDTATGWDDVLNSERKSRIMVYTLSGFAVAQYSDCSFSEVAQRLRAAQHEGLFILRAENESVKLMIGGE